MGSQPKEGRWAPNLHTLHINIVCCYASKHEKRQFYHLIIDRLSFIHQTINCMRQTWPTQSTRHPAIWYAYSRHLPCLPWYQLWLCHFLSLSWCQLWESFWPSLKFGILDQWDIWLPLTNFSGFSPMGSQSKEGRWAPNLHAQQMSIAIKHVVDDNFVYPQDTSRYRLCQKLYFKMWLW